MVKTCKNHSFQRIFPSTNPVLLRFSFNHSPLKASLTPVRATQQRLCAESVRALWHRCTCKNLGLRMVQWFFMKSIKEIWLVLKCLKHKQVRIHPEITVKMIHFQAKHGIEALPHGHPSALRSKIRNAERQWPSWHWQKAPRMIRMSGGKVVLRCGSRTIVENRSCTSKKFQCPSFNAFLISLHISHYIGFQEGISIRQKELVWIVQIHTIQIQYFFERYCKHSHWSIDWKVWQRKSTKAMWARFGKPTSFLHPHTHKDTQVGFLQIG